MVNDDGNEYSLKTTVSNCNEVGTSSVESESYLSNSQTDHSSAKLVDVTSAKHLAFRLYHLDGYEKTHISCYLSPNKEYNQGRLFF